jgi:hypothetical protein
MNTFLEHMNKLLGRRFLLAYWLPTLAFTVALAGLGWLIPGWPIPPAEVGRLLPDEPDGASWLLTLAALLGITLVAWLLSFLGRPLVRLAEGYGWPAPLRKGFLRLSHRQWARLQRRHGEAIERGDRAREAEVHARRFFHYPHRREALLPTRLGNILRAAERYPNDVYGLDGVFWWPRLFPLLPENVQAMVNDAYTGMLAALNLLAGELLLMGMILGFSARHDLRAALLPLLGLLLLARLAWASALGAAQELGEAVRVAYDEYRFLILETLRIPLPLSPEEERALWPRLTAWLYSYDRRASAALHYRHPPDP